MTRSGDTKYIWRETEKEAEKMRLIYLNAGWKCDEIGEIKPEILPSNAMKSRQSKGEIKFKNAINKY